VTFQKQKLKKSVQLKTTWIRFPRDESANLTKAVTQPLAFAIVGQKKTGKSALAELLADRYSTVIDVYGSRDNEGLAWLRSKRKDSVLLLKGASVKVDCNCADVMNTVDVKLKDLAKYEAVVSCAGLYSQINEEWYSITKLFDTLWHRQSWRKPWCLVIREASNLIYSRISIGDTQQMAKSYMLYVIREMRHCGFAVALDTLRWHAIDIDFRSIVDYTFIKAVGIDWLPSSLRFIYRWVDAGAIMRMPVYAFVVVASKGPIGFGRSICPAYHKQERENLLELFDIRTEYGEVAFTGETGFGKVSDYEHVRIIKARAVKGENGKPKGMEKLGKEIGRSSKTIFTHLNMHNNMVHAVGECDRCARVGSKYAKELID
jgi:hypothetical protein